MLSFNNDPELKKQILVQLKKHHDADKIIKGKYGADTRINFLIYNIFKGLPNELAKTWPLRIFEAIPVGIDTRNLINLFNSKVLIDPEFGLIKISDKPFIKTIGELLFKVGSGISLSDEELALGDETTLDSRPVWDASFAWDAWAARAVWWSWSSRSVWDAREVREAGGDWAIRAARSSWEAWANRSASEAREVREAWSTRSARSAWDAQASGTTFDFWTARAAWEARDTWAAGDTGDTTREKIPIVYSEWLLKIVRGE
jgi:hypothetical protein